MPVHAAVFITQRHIANCKTRWKYEDYA